MSTVYRFRSECVFDVVEFLKIAATREGTEIERYEIECDHTRGGGCEVAFWSPESDGSGFRRVLQEIADGYVMVETLALSKHYTGERTMSEAAQALRLQKEAWTPREFLRAARAALAAKNATVFLCRHRNLLQSSSWAGATVPILHRTDAQELLPTPALRAIIDALEGGVGVGRTRRRVAASDSSLPRHSSTRSLARA